AVGVSRVDQDRSGDSARDLQVTSRKLHRRGLDPVLSEHRNCRSRGARHDQSQVVSLLIVLDATEPAIHRRESESKWQLQLKSPKLSFSCNSCPLANASPPTRFFPSSC